MNQNDKRNIRGAVMGGLFLLAAGLGGGALAAEASKTPTLNLGLPVTCVGQSTETYAPPVTSAAQSILVTDTVNAAQCLGGFIGRAQIQGASVSPDLSCYSLLNASDEVLNVTWNDGRTSTLSLTYASIGAQGSATVVVYEGTVTAGAFAGYNVKRTTVYASPDVTGRCLVTNGGVTDISGATTLVLSPVL